MNDTSKIKHVSEIDMIDKAVIVQKPFSLQKENHRQFIRLEISSPMQLHQIKDVFGAFRPQDGESTIDGTVMNISNGGLLVELEAPINEGDIVTMKFSLQGVESLQNVLGLVKRVDIDEDYILVGIQFINRSILADHLSLTEMELMNSDCSDLHGSVRTVLERYIERDTASAEV